MSILIKPIITEKMTEQGDKFNRFGFVVDRNSNKIEIKKEVEKAYNVTVDSVKTMVCIGKKRVRGTKSGQIISEFVLLRVVRGLITNAGSSGACNPCSLA